MEPLASVKINVSVVAGSKDVLIRQLLKLGRGAIIPLDARADDPVTIYANNEAVALAIVEAEDERLRVRVERTLPRSPERMAGQ